MTSRGQHQRTGPHQNQGQSSKEPAGGPTLVHPLAPGQRCPHQPDPNDGSSVQAAKSFQGERKECDALPPTSLGTLSRSSPASPLQSRASLGGSPINTGRAERAGHGHVDSAIPAAHPAADGDVARPSRSARQQVPGSKCPPSPAGPRSAPAAAPNKTSPSMLRRAIPSPAVPQPKERSPTRPPGAAQAGQGPPAEHTGTPSLHPTTGTNPEAPRRSPRAGEGTTESQPPACGRPREDTPATYPPPPSPVTRWRRRDPLWRSTHRPAIPRLTPASASTVESSPIPSETTPSRG